MDDRSGIPTGNRVSGIDTFQPPCAPEDYGKCLAVEGGSTMQEGDLNRPHSQISMNLSPPYMGIAGSSAQGEKRKVPDINDKSEQRKKGRGPNWATNETTSLLLWKLEAIESGDARSWSRVASEHLFLLENIDRGFESCQGRWDTVLKEFKTIRNHELHCSADNSRISFWKMGNDEESKRERKRQNLPPLFRRGWYVLIEKILQVETDNKNASTKVTTSIHRPLSTTHTATTTIDSSEQQAEDEEQGTRDDHLMYSRMVPFIAKQIDDALSAKMLHKCVHCNSMGNAIPSGVQAPEGFNVARSLVHGYHTDFRMPSNEVPSHADLENTVGEANLNCGETSLAYGDKNGTCSHPENVEDFLEVILRPWENSLPPLEDTSLPFLGG